jgi:hypothetical protein
MKCLKGRNSTYKVALFGDVFIFEKGKRWATQVAVQNVMVKALSLARWNTVPSLGNAIQIIVLGAQVIREHAFNAHCAKVKVR